MHRGQLVHSAIFDQKAAWISALSRAKALEWPQPYVFVGSGTSYYLALVLARFSRLLGMEASAYPSCDMLMEPDSVVDSGATLFVISRSGSTSEAIWAADTARQMGHPVVAVTCEAQSPLALGADDVLAVPEGQENTVVMTRSFTSMLMIVEASLALTAGRSLAPGQAMVDDVEAVTLDADKVMRELMKVRPRRIYLLGGGVRYGIALEGVLKCLEMTNQDAYAYPPLEFRHGPWGSVTSEDVVIVLGQTGFRQHEQQVVRDLQRFSPRILVIAPPAWFEGLGEGVAALPIGQGIDEAWLGPLVTVPLQLAGWHWAVHCGRNPDAPVNLGAVVVLSHGQ